MKKLVLNITEEDLASFEAICEKHKIVAHEVVTNFIKDTANCPTSNLPEFIVQAMAYFIKVYHKMHQTDHIAKYAAAFSDTDITNKNEHNVILNISISNEDYKKFESACASQSVDAIRVIESFIEDVGHGSKCNDPDTQNSALRYFDMLWMQVAPETNEFYRDMDGGLHRKDEAKAANWCIFKRIYA